MADFRGKPAMGESNNFSRINNCMPLLRKRPTWISFRADNDRSCCCVSNCSSQDRPTRCLEQDSARSDRPGTRRLAPHPTPSGELQRTLGPVGRPQGGQQVAPPMDPRTTPPWTLDINCLPAPDALRGERADNKPLDIIDLTRFCPWPPGWIIGCLDIFHETVTLMGVGFSGSIGGDCDM